MHKVNLISKEDVDNSLLRKRNKLKSTSIEISWALIFFTMPTVLLNVILSASLIYVIVTDYIEYIYVISQ